MQWMLRLARRMVAILPILAAASSSIADDDGPASMRQYIGKSTSDFVGALSVVAECQRPKVIEVELTAGDRVFGEAEPIEWQNPLNKPPALFKDSDLEPAYRSGEIHGEFRSKRIAIVQCHFENGRRAVATSLDGLIFNIRLDSCVCALQKRGACRISETPMDRAAVKYYRAHFQKTNESLVSYNSGHEFTSIRVDDICERYLEHEFVCAIAITSADNVATIVSFLVYKPLFAKESQYKLSNVLFTDVIRERDAHLALRKELSEGFVELDRRLSDADAQKKRKREILDIYK